MVPSSHAARAPGATVLALALLLAGCAEEALRCGPETCPSGWTCAADGRGCVADGAPDGAPPPLPGTWLSVAARPDGLAVLATYDASRDALAVGWFEADGAVRFHFPDGAGDPAAALPPAGRDVGQYPSIAVGGDGLPRVAYYDRTEGDLRFARFDGAGWQTEVVDGVDADVGRYASLAVDSRDRPHIASYDATHAVLRYATRADAGWTVETVPLDSVSLPAGGAGSDGGDGGAHATAWDLGAPADYGRFSSLGLSLGEPVVAFYEAVGGDLLLARRAVDGWTVILLDGRDPASRADRGDVGQHASLAVDASGDVSVAYFDATAGALRYVRGAAGAVAVEVVDDGARSPDGADWPGCARHVVGQRAALALGSDGRARIAYLDATDLTLRWAESGGSGHWSRRSLDTETGAGVWLDHATLGAVSFVAYAHVDLYRARPTELRFLRVEP